MNKEPVNVVELFCYMILFLAPVYVPLFFLIWGVYEWKWYISIWLAYGIILLVIHVLGESLPDNTK